MNCIKFIDKFSHTFDYQIPDYFKKKIINCIKNQQKINKNKDIENLIKKDDIETWNILNGRS